VGEGRVDRRAHDQRAGGDTRRKAVVRNAYRRRRCTSWQTVYEWQRSGPVKQPYFIAFEDGEAFGMGGLWERWRDPSTGEPLETCCIVTTSPSPAVAHVHDRMPVIVPSTAYAEWLDPKNEDVEGLAKQLAPYPEKEMATHPLSTLVNNPRFDDPRCIQSGK
jgi:putative SOS response-associated peptidase YedK